MPNEAISFSRWPGLATAPRLSMRSVTVGTSTSAACDGSTSSPVLSGLSSTIQPRVEQLHHPRLDGVGQLAGDDDVGRWRGIRWLSGVPPLGMSVPLTETAHPLKRLGRAAFPFEAGWLTPMTGASRQAIWRHAHHFSTSPPARATWPWPAPALAAVSGLPACRCRVSCRWPRAR